MADKKISALPASTTPLAGTEVLPIVQSSTTKQVSVANLTIGRTQTSNGIVQGTAATGYNFTANTPAAGMTSQLLNWYEQGTWSPNDASGAGLTLTTIKALYTRIGNVVTINAFIIYPSTASVAAAKIGGLPFTSATNNYTPGTIIPSNNASVACYVATASTEILLVSPINYGTSLTNVTLSTSGLFISISYEV